MRKDKGITLVALIITIVVMLILVAVSVNILIKSNLIGTAEKTTNKYKMASEEEANGGAIEIDGKKYNSIEDYMEGKEKLPDIKAGERATANSNYNGAVIPKGFTVSGISTEQKVDNGLVIYDIPEGTTPDWSNPDSVKTKYNQFVWIPVEVKSSDTENSIASFYRSLWTVNESTGGERTNGLSTDYTEPDSTNDTADKTGIADQITELTKSIYKYGGFYIGRYEAGRRTDSSSQTASFVVQQDKYPYNYVKWGKSMSDVSEGAVYLCNNLYTPQNTNYGATSMLCTGASWDSMLDFIKDSNHSVTDSTTWGNYNNSETYTINRGKYAELNTSNYTLGNFQDVGNEYSKEKNKSILLTTGATGTTERNSSKNIYDVAGNVFEWTTESYTSSSSSSGRVIRGRRLPRQWFCPSSEFPRLLRSDPQLLRRRVSPSTLCKAVGLYAIY